MLPMAVRFWGTVYFCNSSWRGQRSRENGRVRVLGIPPFRFCMAHYLIFAAPRSGAGTYHKDVFRLPTSSADTTDRPRTHIPLLYFRSGWKPLWRVKVSGETREQEKPRDGWLTAEGARQILGPLVKSVSQQSSLPSVTPRGAAQ